jgi:hypothetical protein
MLMPPNSVGHKRLLFLSTEADLKRAVAAQTDDRFASLAGAAGTAASEPSCQQAAEGVASSCDSSDCAARLSRAYLDCHRGFKKSCFRPDFKV